MEHPQTDSTGIVLKDGGTPIGICLGYVHAPSDDAALDSLCKALVDSPLDASTISTVEKDTSVSTVVSSASPNISCICICVGEGKKVAEATANSFLSTSVGNCNSKAIWLENGFYFQSSGIYQRYIFRASQMLNNKLMSIVLTSGTVLETGTVYLIENDHLEWLRCKVLNKESNNGC